MAVSVEQEVYLKAYIGRGQSPREDHFGIRQICDIGVELENGDILVRTLFLGMSPSLRFSLNEDSATTCSAGRISEGQVLASDGIGVVQASRSSVFQVGDLISNRPKLLAWPWRSMVRFQERDLIGACDRWNDSHFVCHQPEVVVDGLGISGMTAYFGISDYLHPGPNSVLVVSAASGAVGSIAGQIGKRLGFTRVVGVTSSSQKAEFIRQLGFDEAVVYNSGASAEWQNDLRSACGGGIDGYFDNVGGDVSLAVAELLNEGATCAICGAMSQTAHGGNDQAWVELARRRGAAVQWFRYTSYMDDEDGRITHARAQLQQWMDEGALKIVRTYFDGLASASSCFVRLFSASKLGKALVRVST